MSLGKTQQLVRDSNLLTCLLKYPRSCPPTESLLYLGWVGLIDKPAESNSPLVDILISLGAVPYVKTNIPQSLMVCTAHHLLELFLTTYIVDVRLIQPRLSPVVQLLQSGSHLWWEFWRRRCPSRLPREYRRNRIRHRRLNSDSIELARTVWTLPLGGSCTL
jgi:hypothetical protein